MDNKDREQIEDILEKSAKRIEMKPFADRWKDIESRLEFDRTEKYELANTEIFYIRTDDSELIEYKVLAKHNNVTYELNYLALSDNLIAFFNEFFS